MENDKEILERLHSISEKEWRYVIDKLTVFVHFKLKGKTLFGAHSTQYLGIKAIDYYVDEAVAKLFSLEWKWQYEKYTLIDQLKRIIGSMISTNVESFKKRIEKITPTENDVLYILIEKGSLNDNDDYDLTYLTFKKALEECSQDDEDLQLYAMALEECNSFDEMSAQLGWDKKKLYSLQQKMTRRIIKNLETKKEQTK